MFLQISAVFRQIGSRHLAQGKQAVFETCQKEKKKIKIKQDKIIVLLELNPVISVIWLTDGKALVEISIQSGIIRS